MVVKMRLSPNYKKTVIKLITEKIFISFNSRTYHKELTAIIADAAIDENMPDAVSIKYKGEYYCPFIKTAGVPFKAVVMTESNKYFPKFKHLLDRHQEYSELTSQATNYLRTGLAMCITADDMCVVFPEFILEIINTIHDASLIPLPVHTLREMPPVLDKHVKFQQRFKQIHRNMKRQIVVNILTSGTQNADHPV
jgi:hypothetical protein